MDEAALAELVFEFFSSLGAGLGGNDGRSNYHSDESEGNHKVMHV